jgi:hypothetical protein
LILVFLPALSAIWFKVKRGESKSVADKLIRPEPVPAE